MAEKLFFLSVKHFDTKKLMNLSIYFWDGEESFYDEDLIFFNESIRICDIKEI